MNQVIPKYGRDFAPGYTFFSRTDDNFLSQGITWFQTLQEAATFVASHVALVVDEHTGIEAAGNGIQPFDLQKRILDPSLQIVFREPSGMPGSTAVKAIAYGQHMVGRPYDVTGLALGFPVMLLTGLTKWIPPLRKLPLPFHLPGSRVCSAFVADCYKHTLRYEDVELLKKWHVSRITPVMLWNDFPYKQFRFERH